jgi:hypothetical protein
MLPIANELLRVVDPAQQQREFQQRIDLARLNAAHAWAANGRRPEEMAAVAVYVGAMALSIVGGSVDARWAIADELRRLGVSGDFVDEPPKRAEMEE